MTLQNDGFLNAISLTGNPVNVTGTNIGATAETSEPDHSDYGPIEYRNSVWWSWTAPETGPVQINTFGSNFNTTLGVYTGSSLSNLTVVGQSDGDQGPNGTDKITFMATQGTTYKIAVDGSYAATGNIKLNILQESNSTTTLSGNYIQLPIDDADLDAGQMMQPGATGQGTGGIKYFNGTNFVDFFDYGVPIFDYSIGVNGRTYTDGNGWAIAPTVLDQSLGPLNQATVSGSPVNGLNFERVISFLDNDKIIAIQDTFTNVGSTTLFNVVTLDNADPDPGGTQITNNDVVSNGLVVASINNGNGYTVGFGSIDAASHVTVDGDGYTIPDPYAILSSNVDPNGSADDININLAMNYGSLLAGQSKTKTWYIVFGNTKNDAILTYNGTVAAASPVASTTTFNSPSIGDAAVAYGETFTITVVYDSAMDTTISPTITFPTVGESPLNTIQFLSQAWSGDRTFTATYTLVDANETVPNIDVRISGAKSTNGKTQLVADYANAFSIDTQAPAAPSAPNLDSGSDLGYLSDDNITSDNSPTFIGTGEAGSTVELIRQSDEFVLGSGVVLSSGSWTITPNFLGDGAYTVYTRARDAAGNISIGQSSTISFTIDTIAPAVSTPDLTDGSDTGKLATDNITNNTLPIFSGTAETGSKVELWEGNKLMGSVIAQNGSWQITPTSALSAGSHTLIAKAIDAAGNVRQSASDITVTIDATVPTVTLNSLTTGDSTPRLSGTVSDNDLTTKIEVTIEGQTYLATNNRNGTWELADGAIAPALSPSTYDVTVTATDAAGNTTTLNNPNALVIDLALPVVTINSRITRDTTPALSGTVSDASAIVSVTVNGTTYNVVPNSDKTWVLGDGRITSALAEGVYDVAASANVQGRIGTDNSTGELTIDTTPPTVTIQTLKTGDSTPALQGTVNDPNATILVTVSGNDRYATNNGNGTWTLANNALPTLTSGTYNVTVKAFDLAGNQGVDNTTYELTIDTVPLTADIVNVSPDPRSTSTPSITLNFNKAITGLDLSDLILTRNGTSIALTNTTLTTTNNTSWVLGNLSALTTALGSYTLVLKAASGITDAVGHTLTTNVADTWQMEGAMATTPTPIPFTGGLPGKTLRGNTANNTLTGGSYNDYLTGASGNDTLYGRNGLDRLYGDASNDRLYGDAGNDRLYGGIGNDILDGGSDRDLLNGDAGADRLLGNYGDDVLLGGAGSDTLVGGAGRDVFKFNRVTDRGDRITDFALSADLIDLRGIFAQPAFSGTSAYSRFTRYVRLVQGTTGTDIKIDTDGSGLGTTFATLATLNNVRATQINSRHFIVT
ncbi:Ig-like domain-containing protein [Leptolyngbya sp. FACHB-16]|uniref:beta strand repeat-containing protein n=1 Tax=unclassified Leptolyngbya TaxID=2650499 RepID=UPI001682B980|nr:Ig-like domain-containing protein [Leptolyngbya sp. FACHB-16]MBD2158135.1 Ig-like domain repeat protein [Leptolyngbya sp. FACHB-16]